MKFDPKKLNALAVCLHGRQIGVINRLAGERHIFAFEQDYIADPQRPTLSLPFKSSTGGLVTAFCPVSFRVPPFFSNLLPEGHLRTYLAKLAGVKPERGFFLLAVLGPDLPGAVVVRPLEGHGQDGGAHDASAGGDHDDRSAMRFSLAGVQLKFSAVMEASGGLSVPADGMGGSWIVKLPSARFPAVPENEFVMLELARRVGIAVPPLRIVEVGKHKGRGLHHGRHCPRRRAVRPPPRRRPRAHGGFRASVRALSR